MLPWEPFVKKKKNEAMDQQPVAQLLLVAVTLLTINKIVCHKSNYTTSISTVCVYIHVYNPVSYGTISYRGSEESESRPQEEISRRRQVLRHRFMVKVHSVQQIFLKLTVFPKQLIGL